MSDEILNNLAARVAVAMNGGNWNAHYTEAQKQLWRDRITGMIGGSNE